MKVLLDEFALEPVRAHPATKRERNMISKRKSRRKSKYRDY